MMGSLAQSRRFAIAPAALGEIRARFTAGRADEGETAAAMRTVAYRRGRCAGALTSRSSSKTSA